MNNVRMSKGWWISMSKHNSNVDNGGKAHSVGLIILHTTIKKKWLSLGIITSVCGAVITALYPQTD